MKLTQARRTWRQRTPGELRRRAYVDDASRGLLQYFVVPVWIGAGLAEWICHRKTRIETTAGVQESAIHSVMMIEGGPGGAGNVL